MLYLSKRYTRLTLSLLILATLLLGCHPKECGDLPSGAYTFTLPVTITPEQDRFKVGDTIFISSIFDFKRQEKFTGITYELDDFNFHPLTTVERYLSNTTFYDFSDMEVILDLESSYDGRFTSSDGQEIITGSYDYIDGIYRLSLQVVPKVPGLYALFQGSLLFPNGENQSFPGKCEDRTINGVQMVVNNKASNGIELLEARRAENERIEWILREPDFRFHGMGGFAFEVVE